VGRLLLAISMIGLVAVAAPACRSTEPAPAAAPTSPTGRAISVPADEPTIQAAVDRASAGDLVLVSPGTYHEAVHVRTARVVVRGVDRNGVILDGGGTLEHGLWLSASAVAVENLTTRNYTDSGITVGGAGPAAAAAGAPDGTAAQPTAGAPASSAGSGSGPEGPDGSGGTATAVQG
jgi:hypothetical protein